METRIVRHAFDNVERVAKKPVFAENYSLERNQKLKAKQTKNMSERNVRREAEIPSTAGLI